MFGPVRCTPSCRLHEYVTERNAACSRCMVEKMGTIVASEHYLHTGQRSCHADDGREVPCQGSGQDASFAVGTSWPEPRFESHDHEVMDRLTGLLWRRAARLTPQAVVWSKALVAVAELKQQDAAIAWRLPTINELEVLVDCATHSPSLPSGHPFADVQDIYWSSTTSLFEPDWAWALYLKKGATGFEQKRYAEFSVWAVASGLGTEKRPPPT